MTLESRYSIVEKLGFNEPEHLRARSSVTGDLVSVFAFRQGESAVWQRSFANVQSAMANRGGVVVETFIANGHPVVVTPPLPESTLLDDYLARASNTPESGTRASSAAHREVGSDWSRVRERFQTPAAPAAPVAPLPPVPTLAPPAPEKKRSAVPGRILKAVSSELDIFEARTIRVDLPAGQDPLAADFMGGLDFQAPPKLLDAYNAASQQKIAAQTASLAAAEIVNVEKLSVATYVLYATGIVGLAVAVSAYLLK